MAPEIPYSGNAALCWYEYDALNRFTVTMGSLSGERPVDPNDASVSIVPGRAGGEGVRLGYNAAGERVLAVYAKDGRTEQYTYDANGYLETQSINGVGAQARTNDLLGRAIRVVERRPDNGQVVSDVTRSWDADSILLSERDRVAGNTTTYTRMADGTVARVDVKPDDVKGTRSSFVYEYEWWDGAKQSKITAQGANQNAPGWRPASSWFNYDVNGNLKSTYDVGNQGNDGIDQIDYVKELAGKLQKGNDSQFKVFTPVGTADFDESFMTINGVYPGTSPGVWTVRDGDSLKSIASALWGDETLWYVLADANGLKSTDELKAGRLLTVPNKVTNVHNTASTFKPYGPGKAIGNTQPTLPDPPPPPGRGGGCGGFLPVIAIVVAVVATVFTAGALTAPAGASFSAMMSAGGTALTGGAGLAGAGAAAVGGAVGAASAQGVMIAGGAQNGFDWKGVALGAVGAGVTAGAGGALGAVNNVQTAVALGAARSVATQGIGVATGLQHSFDWKGVAASAIASGVGFEAGRVIGSSVSGMRPDVGRFITRAGSGAAAGLASTVVRGGSLGRNVGAIAIDAVASSVGNMVVDQIADRPTSTELRTQQAIAAMNGQILPGGAGSAGTGFVPANASYIRFENSPQASAPMALANYDSPAGIQQARAQRIAELQLLAEQPLDQGFSGVQVLIEGVGSTGGPVLQPAAELGTIRNLNWFESQLAFNPVAQAAQGFVDQGLTLASGAWNVVSHPVNTVARIGGHYANAYEAGNLGGTILRDASGIAAGVVKGALSPIDALYRQNEAGGAYRLGGSMMDAALSAATPGAVSAATRLGGAGLERGVAIFGPTFDRAANSFLANRGMLLHSAPENVFQTGARQVLDPNSMKSWDAAESAYDAIRASNTDVLAISKNTGISEVKIARIKDHVFFNNHTLDSGVRRFDADPDIVNAWDRLKTGDWVGSDLDLLQHERFESRFEAFYKSDYRTAHDAAIRSGRTWMPE